MDNLVHKQKVTRKKRKLKTHVKGYLVLTGVFLLSLTCTNIVHSITKTNLNDKLVKADKELKKNKSYIDSLEAEIKKPFKTYGNKTRASLKEKRLNSSLILQRDERWSKEPYGWGINTTVDKNACAIASLSMINAYWKNTELSITDVLNWAGNDYYTDYGTSWNIFPAFAQNYGYTYTNLGTQIESALPYLEKDIPVVASFNPGIFTSVGHIMVLSHADEDGIRILDPNDDVSKKFSLTTYSTEDIQASLAHLWVFEETN